jgi:hypothetical protein
MAGHFWQVHDCQKSVVRELPPSTEGVCHPFGTIKAWMGATHFLTKTIPRVSAEMSLHVLAYNLKRAMRIVGIAPLMMAMRA